MKPPEYKETSGIPICPYCQKPTKRSNIGPNTSTLMAYAIVFDENGRDISEDHNTHRSTYQCHTCGKTYTISGNQYKGYQYIGLALEEADDEQRTET